MYYDILNLLTNILTLVIGLLLGHILTIRTQKKQIWYEYVTDVVKREYPEILSEVNLRTKQLDNFLNDPLGLTWSFPKMNDIINRGIISLIGSYHKDLFSVITLYRENVIPKIKQLDDLRKDIIKVIKNSWVDYLKDCLSEEMQGKLVSSTRINDLKSITYELIDAVAPYNVLTDLLNNRYKESKKKIKRLLDKRMTELNLKIEEYESLVEKLIEIAKPEIEKMKNFYKKLKEQNDVIAKRKLIPLLGKYIQKPI